MPNFKTQLKNIANSFDQLTEKNLDKNFEKSLQCHLLSKELFGLIESHAVYCKRELEDIARNANLPEEFINDSLVSILIFSPEYQEFLMEILQQNIATEKMETIKFFLKIIEKKYLNNRSSELQTLNPDVSEILSKINNTNLSESNVVFSNNEFSSPAAKYNEYSWSEVFFDDFRLTPDALETLDDINLGGFEKHSSQQPNSFSQETLLPAALAHESVDEPADATTKKSRKRKQPEKQGQASVGDTSIPKKRRSMLENSSELIEGEEELDPVVLVSERRKKHYVFNATTRTWRKSDDSADHDPFDPTNPNHRLMDSVECKKLNRNNIGVFCKLNEKGFFEELPDQRNLKVEDCVIASRPKVNRRGGRTLKDLTSLSPDTILYFHCRKAFTRRNQDITKRANKPANSVPQQSNTINSRIALQGNIGSSMHKHTISLSPIEIQDNHNPEVTYPGTSSYEPYVFSQPVTIPMSQPLSQILSQPLITRRIDHTNNLYSSNNPGHPPLSPIFNDCDPSPDPFTYPPQPLSSFTGAFFNQNISPVGQTTRQTTRTTPSQPGFFHSPQVMSPSSFMTTNTFSLGMPHSLPTDNSSSTNDWNPLDVTVPTLQQLELSFSQNTTHHSRPTETSQSSQSSVGSTRKGI